MASNVPATTIRIDPEVKREAVAVLDELGLSMSGAMNIFLRAVARLFSGSANSRSCQIWSNRAFLFTGAIVDKPKARTIIMTGERYFFFDKRNLSGTWGRSFSAGTQGHSLLWPHCTNFVCAR